MRKIPVTTQTDKIIAQWDKHLKTLLPQDRLALIGMSRKKLDKMEVDLASWASQGGSVSPPHPLSAFQISILDGQLSIWENELREELRDGT
jgi:hypothetical protein